MLNTDMELLYNINPNDANQPTRCNRFSQTTCPVTNQFDFPTWVQQFAEKPQPPPPPANGTDEPGASRWLSVFARAFNKMGSVAYSNLQCLKCASADQGTLSDNEYCVGPQYGCYNTTNSWICPSFQNTTTTPSPSNSSSSIFFPRIILLILIIFFFIL